MNIVELCNINNKTGKLHNFLLSKKIYPNETYNLSKSTMYRLKDINEHNAILSRPGKNRYGSNVLRLSHDISQNILDVNYSRNYISIIPFKVFPLTLRTINISHNIIRNLNNIKDTLPNLREFNCSHNPIKQIPELPPNLQGLKTNNCFLTNLPEFPISMRKIIVNNNRLTYLPDSLIRCNHLETLNYENNLNIQVTEEQLEFIERIFEAIREREERARLLRGVNVLNNLPNRVKTVHNDAQNVHDVTIRKEVSDAIKKLSEDKCEITFKQALLEFSNVIGASNISRQNGFRQNAFGKNNWHVNYSNNPVADYIFIQKICNMPGVDSKTKMSFSKLFKFFWNRIRNNDNRDEIMKIFLTEDIPEMKIVCFVGRISRIINCLSGFFDDIQIKISLSQQIECKYNVVSNKYKDIIHDDMQYNIRCKYHLIKLLKEIEVKKEIIDGWISPFCEEIEELICEKYDVDDSVEEKEYEIIITNDITKFSKMIKNNYGVDLIKI